MSGYVDAADIYINITASTAAGVHWFPLVRLPCDLVCNGSVNTL